MTARRSMSILRGLLTLAITLLLLVGVPTGLILFVGWPLPTSMPTADALSRAMQIGISDEFVVNALTVIVWIAWAQLVLAMGSQSVAAVRGRGRVHVPVLPGMQAFAARLVTGMLLLIGPLQPARAGAAPMPVPIVADAHPASEVAVDDVIDLRAEEPGWWANGEPPVVAESGETVTVQRHDSYLAIAERTLGDGLRWREIHDLNVGRTMADGHVIVTGDDTLRAGWQLAVPSGATVSEPMMATQPSPVATATGDGVGNEVVVEAGDNLWYMAEDRLAEDLERPPVPAEVTPYWSEVIEANHDRFVEPGNPSLILPGQVLVMPASGHAVLPPPTPVESPAPIEPAPAVEPAPEPEPTTTEPAATTPTTTPSTTEVPASSTSLRPEDGGVAEPEEADVSRAVTDGSESEDDSSALPMAIAVGGLSSIALAVGAKRLLNNRRRQYANNHAGQAPPPTDPEQRDLHHAVVAMADEVQLDDLQLVLGSLAVELAEAGSPRRPRVVRHSTESLEILLDQPDLEPPAGWTAEGAGLVWTLDGKLALDEEAVGAICPAPLLVTIGQPDDDAQIYLDLEVDGVVSLAGDIEVARNLARSMLTELALAPLADTLQVIVIGDLVEPDASHFDHVQMVETWDDIAEDLTFWAGESHEALQENGWDNTFVARGSEPDHDALVPIVVIATKPPPPVLLASLLETRPSAVAVVVADEFEDAAASICCTAEALTIDDIDLSFVPQQVDADELQAMARLLVFNDSPEPAPQNGQADAEASEVGDDNITQENEPISTGETADGSERSEPPECEVLVRLLGDIRIDGGTKPLNAKPTAVAAYLAIHRELTADRLEEACWFGSDGTSHRKLLLDAMSECRAALGRTHFPSNRHGTYRVDAAIRTDVELFEWHVGRAARQVGVEAMESYRAALDLVTGRPFTYPNASRRSFGWVDYEHHATTWEHKVTNVAKAFAELCLDIDRHEDAIDRLRRLLQVIPLSGDLVAALMRAHLATGDRSAAEALYQEHSKALSQADLGDLDEAVERVRGSFGVKSRRANIDDLNPPGCAAGPVKAVSE